MKDMNTINGKKIVFSATALLLLFLMIAPVANAQVGIGTETPASDAALDITSTTKGFLMPRMTTTERLAIGSGTPTAGMMVIDTELNAVMVYDGANWIELGTGVKQTSAITNNDGESTTVTATSIVDIWEQESTGGAAGQTGDVNYTTGSDYVVEDVSYVEVADGDAKLILTESDGVDDCTGGTASASDFYDDGSGTYEPDKAFDDDNGTYWSSDLAKSRWVEYNFGVGNDLIVTKYSIRAREASDRLSNMPKDWTFEGYNGSAWDELDSQSGVTDWSVDEVKEYTFTNTTSYERYRINISSNNGGGTTNIVEMTMEAIDAYQTTDGYYVETKDASNIDQTNMTVLNSLTFTSSGAGSSKFAVSIDERSTWYYYNSGTSTWETMTLSDFDSKGTDISTFTSTDISSLLGDASAASCDHFDIAVDLKATDASTNAVVSNVTLNYDYAGSTFFKKVGVTNGGTTDYEITRASANGSQTITITNSSGGAKTFVIDYLK